MDLGTDLAWLGISLKIFFIDVMLGGDNAIVIAVACRGLPPALVPRAVAMGAAGAVFFRVVIASMAGTLLTMPAIKTVSGVVLAIIAVNLLAAEYREKKKEDEDFDLDPGLVGKGDWMGAALLILVVDAIMSLDNVVALAAVSEGNALYLIGGIVFSVPFLFWGSLIVSEAMRHFPVLFVVGTALLGWVGGELVVTDPLWSGWIAGNAEALTVFVPAAAAVFVVLEAKITAQARDAEEGDVARVRVQAPPAMAVRAAERPSAPPAPARPAAVARAAVVSPAASPVERLPERPKLAAGPADIGWNDLDDGRDPKNDRVMLIGLLFMLLVVSTILISAVVLSNTLDP